VQITLPLVTDSQKELFICIYIVYSGVPCAVSIYAICSYMAARKHYLGTLTAYYTPYIVPPVSALAAGRGGYGYDGGGVPLCAGRGCCARAVLLCEWGGVSLWGKVVGKQ